MRISFRPVVAISLLVLASCVTVAAASAKLCPDETSQQRTMKMAERGPSFGRSIWSGVPAETPEHAAARKLVEKQKALSLIEQEKGNWQKAADLLELGLEAKLDPHEKVPLIEDVIASYVHIGRWDRMETFHKQLASMQRPTSIGASRQHQFLAAICQLRQAKYSDANKLLEDLIAEAEKHKDDKNSDVDYLKSDPSYAECLSQLGNSLLDGSSSYDKALALYDKSIKAANAPRLSMEAVLNLLICCDASGNKDRADKYRAELKQKISDLRVYGSKYDAGSSSALAQAMTLIDKSKRSRAEEVRLMELIPRSVIFDPPLSSDARSRDNDVLLIRAISIRKQRKETQKLLDDYGSLCKLLLANGQGGPKSGAEEFCWLRLNALRDSNAPKTAIALAEGDFASALQGCYRFASASQYYKQSLPIILAGEKSGAIEVLLNLAQCLQKQDRSSEAITFLEKALTLAPARLATRIDLNMKIGVEYDILGDKSKAQQYYLAANSLVKGVNQSNQSQYASSAPNPNAVPDNFQVMFPLLMAAEDQANRKHFEIADRLFRRRAELVGSKDPAASSAWTQMARMYKNAKKYDKAIPAYQEAIKLATGNQSELQMLKSELSQISGPNK